MNGDLALRLKRLIVDTLRLEGLAAERIGDDEPLFGGGIGLDSIDALELVIAIEKEFGVAVPEGRVDPEVFRTVRTLAAWLEARLPANVEGPAAPALPKPGSA